MWWILVIAGIGFIFIAVAIVHVGAEADKAEKILHEKYLEEKHRERQGN